MTELRQRMIRDMKIRGLSNSTIKTYVYHVANIARHYNKSPAVLTIDEIKKYLVHLKDEQKNSWSARNQLVAALNFLYKTTLNDTTRLLNMPPRKKPKRLPEVLSREEVKRVINAPDNIKHRMLLKTAYSAGLRVSELVCLRPENIDSKRMLIRVEKGKGQKDRYTILSSSLLKELRIYWKKVKPVDWLFPSSWHQYTKDHMHKTSVMKIYNAAKKKAGVTRGKGIHTLRHSFATHLLEAGYDIKTIQALLGHQNIRSTLVYIHVSKRNIALVKSPFDLIADTNELDTKEKDDEDNCRESLSSC
jgi:site-specific recombinase XerD